MRGLGAETILEDKTSYARCAVVGKQAGGAFGWAFIVGHDLICSLHQDIELILIGVDLTDYILESRLIGQNIGSIDIFVNRK